jgi:hypothetical protein
VGFVINNGAIFGGGRSCLKLLIYDSNLGYVDLLNLLNSVSSETINLLSISKLVEGLNFPWRVPLYLLASFIVLLCIDGILNNKLAFRGFNTRRYHTLIYVCLCYDKDCEFEPRLIQFTWNDNDSRTNTFGGASALLC